tara:strand:- start:634 stop:888 length:255 start_codon:yes stop_codon:yes gene_type:complete
MSDIIKFQNMFLCTCKNNVVFEIIPEIECDWGLHTVIQCPKCEELFSIDVKCPAFQTIEKLTKINNQLFTTKEQILYLKNSHPK